MRRLGIEAEHVLFGHTHRAGPLPADDHGEWRAGTGARLHNTGCWVDEPHSSRRAGRDGALLAGRAIELDDERAAAARAGGDELGAPPRSGGASPGVNAVAWHVDAVADPSSRTPCVWRSCWTSG